MAQILIPTQWTTQKPTVNSQINWGHSLARGMVGCWLMNESSGLRTRNLVSGRFAVLTAGAKFQTSTLGSSIYCNGVSSTSDYIAAESIDCVNGYLEFSVVMSLNVKGGGDFNQNGWLWRRDSGSATTGLRFGDNRFLSANTIVLNIDGTTDLNKVWSNPNNNGFGIYTLTYNGSGFAGGALCYKNGKLLSTSGGTTDGVTLGDSTGQATWFGRDGSDRGINGNFFFVYIYNRILSPQEVMSLYIAPYQMIQPLERKFYFVPSGAPPVTNPATGYMAYGKYYGN